MVPTANTMFCRNVGDIFVLCFFIWKKYLKTKESSSHVISPADYNRLVYGIQAALYTPY
jgi:hypothetical protein